MRLAPAVVDRHGQREGQDVEDDEERDDPRVAPAAAATASVAGGEEGEPLFAEGFGGQGVVGGARRRSGDVDLGLELRRWCFGGHGWLGAAQRERERREKPDLGILYRGRICASC